MSDEIELIEVKKGRFMQRDEAIRKGYSWVWLQLADKPKKDAPFWGAAGLEPIILIAITAYVGYLITPYIHAGVSLIINPVFDLIRQM